MDPVMLVIAFLIVDAVSGGYAHGLLGGALTGGARGGAAGAKRTAVRWRAGAKRHWWGRAGLAVLDGATAATVAVARGAGSGVAAAATDSPAARWRRHRQWLTDPARREETAAKWRRRRDRGAAWWRTVDPTSGRDCTARTGWVRRCGRPVVEGTSVCAEHLAEVHQETEDERSGTPRRSGARQFVDGLLGVDRRRRENRRDAARAAALEGTCEGIRDDRPGRKPYRCGRPEARPGLRLCADCLPYPVEMICVHGGCHDLADAEGSYCRTHMPKPVPFIDGLCRHYLDPAKQQQCPNRAVPGERLCRDHGPAGQAPHVFAPVPGPDPRAGIRCIFDPSSDGSQQCTEFAPPGALMCPPHDAYHRAHPYDGPDFDVPAFGVTADGHVVDLEPETPAPTGGDPTDVTEPFRGVDEQCIRMPHGSCLKDPIPGLNFCEEHAVWDDVVESEDERVALTRDSEPWEAQAVQAARNQYGEPDPNDQDAVDRHNAAVERIAMDMWRRDHEAYLHHEKWSANQTPAPTRGGQASPITEGGPTVATEITNAPQLLDKLQEFVDGAGSLMEGAQATGLDVEGWPDFVATSRAFLERNQDQMRPLNEAAIGSTLAAATPFQRT